MPGVGEEVSDSREWLDYVDRQRKSSIRRDKRFSITSKRSAEEKITFEIKSSVSSEERLNQSNCFEIKTKLRDPNETVCEIHSPKSRLRTQSGERNEQEHSIGPITIRNESSEEQLNSSPTTRSAEVNHAQPF